MDRRKGKIFALYTVEEILAYFREEALGFESKQGFELLVGCILAKCRGELSRTVPTVGYMMKGTFSATEERPRPPIRELLASNEIEDRDADIWIDTQTPIQVTRLERVSGDKTPTAALTSLIQKKLKVQPDEFLQLVVLIDYTFDLDLAHFHSDLDHEKIPYARIYLVCQTGTNPQEGAFTCYEVFPELCEQHVKIEF